MSTHKTAYAEFAPSHRTTPPGARLSSIDPEEVITVSVYLQPRETPDTTAIPTRAGLADQRASDHAQDVQRVSQFAASHGLAVADVQPSQRLVRLSGTAAQMQAAFRTHLAVFENNGVAFRGRSGALHLPVDLHDIIQAVLGLDTRAQAQAHNIRALAVTSSFRPNDVATLYNFPTGVTGAGQCIALIELGGGFLASDTNAAFAAMGLTPPRVVAVSVDGGRNAPTPDDGADAEVALDIQVAGGAAPGATIAVYFAPNTDAGFADAISQAVHDATHAPSVVSISWGSAEPNWTAQAVAAMNTAMADAGSLGVSVFAASGDNLATDAINDGKVHVDFPASSPSAIGCGGTRLTATGATVASEVVWNDGSSGTGGGISALFPVPRFQSGAALPADVSTGATGRGVPDVAGNAAPATGYQVVVNGRTGVVGGTSAVAPLWAGLAALINQANGSPIGFFLPTLYAAAAARQITVGSNIPTGTSLGYYAGPGWNACTGLGAPGRCGGGCGVGRGEDCLRQGQGQSPWPCLAKSSLWSGNRSLRLR